MSFKDREDAFESKYAHDQELQFKVEMRRNKLLGIWAAELMGLKGEESDSYAKEVIAADFEEPGDADVIRKVMADMEAEGIEMSEHRIKGKLEEFTSIAKQQIMTE